MARRGFTLMELILVLAMMGILLCLVWPRLEQIGSATALDEAGRLLMDDLRLVREEARLSGGYGVLQTEGRGYRAYLLTADESYKEQRLFQRRFAHGLSWGIGSANQTFLFYGDGSCSPGKHHGIRLEGASGLTYEVTVAQTGRIRKGAPYG